MIKFKSFGGVNIGPFDKFQIDVKPGLHLVIGTNEYSSSSDSNGSGKSFFTEPLLYSIYKKSFRGNDISKHEKGEMRSDLVFDIAGDNLTIARYYKHSSKGNAVEFTNSAGDSLSGRTPTITDSLINNSVGISYELITSTMLIAQGLPINFSSMTNTIRKSVLEEILGFNKWDTYREKFLNYAKTTTQELDELSSEFQTHKEKMIRLNSSVETIKSTQDTNDKEIEISIEEIEKSLNSLGTLFDDSRKQMISKFPSVESESEHVLLESLQDQLDGFSSSLTIIRTKLQDLKIIISSGVCPTCEQSYPQDKITKANQENLFLRKKLKKIQDTKLEISGTLENLKVLIKEQNTLKTKINQSKSNLSIFKSQLEKTDQTEKLNTLVAELEKTNCLVNTLNKQLSTLKIKIESTTYITDLLKPSSTFRSQLLESYLNHINNIIFEVSPIIFDSVQIELKLSDNKSGIDFKILENKRVKNYKSFSGGEKRRIDIIVILAIQRFLFESSGINTNLLIFDEIFDGLDRRGMDLVLSTLESIFPPDMCIFVITHIDQFKSSFDSYIRITRDINGDSFIDLSSYI